MQRASEYLHRAEEAEAQAARATGYMREQFLEPSRQWRVLGRQAADLATAEKERQSTGN